MLEVEQPFQLMTASHPAELQAAPWGWWPCEGVRFTWWLHRGVEPVLKAS